jgi:carboxyl-terminal processing protease
MAALAASIAGEQLGIPAPATILEFTCGAASGLDPYSTFLTAAQLDEVFSQIEGNFVGLGLELKADAAALLIVSVIPGGPAARAGIQPSDRIIAVNGTRTQEVNADAAADMLKGPENSTVDITVLNPQGVERNLRLVRQRVEVPSVEGARIIDANLGAAYLRLSSFQKTTSRDIDNALWNLHRQGMRYLIMDLRGNPGGLLTAAVELADKFLSGGTIVSTRGRSAREDYDYKAHAVGTWRVPLIVLIDRDSASASEIFAAAIHDHQRGTVVGQRSYGKGSVQGIFPLNVAKSGVRLTTAKFYSPTGQPISKHGVEPNVVVQLAARPANQEAAPEPPAANEDIVLNAALRVIQNQLSQR